MLVLDRTKGQSILIGDNITIKIIRTIRGHTKVGINAPKGIKILRQELRDKNSSIINQNCSMEL